MDILDRLEHFKSDREANGDRYGAEVLHHAIAEIARLTKIEKLTKELILAVEARETILGDPLSYLNAKAEVKRIIEKIKNEI